MITTPNAPVIGAKSFSGIWVSGVISIGKAFQAGINAIDLTAQSLDSRVSYNGPAHLYWDASGKLATSTTNAWPLEYRDGVAIGRHQPEPASTNIQVNGRAIAESTNVQKSGTFSIVVDQTGAPDGKAIGCLPVAASSYMVSQDVGGAQIVPLARYNLTSKWQRMAAAARVTDSSRVRIWLGRNAEASNGQPSLWLTQSANVAAGNYVFSWFVKASDDGVTFPAGLGMIEMGNYPYATSPIVTESTSTVTRPASSVTVQRDGNVSGIKIYFSDNTNTNIPFNGAASVTVPFATTHWGERYMTRIEYEA